MKDFTTWAAVVTLHHTVGPLFKGSAVGETISRRESKRSPINQTHPLY